MVDLTVRAWMASAPLTIGPKENLKRARELMRTAKVSELLVVDELAKALEQITSLGTAKVSELLVIDEGKLVGMLSEQDLWEHCPTSAVVLDEQQTDELLRHMGVGGGHDAPSSDLDSRHLGT